MINQKMVENDLKKYGQEHIIEYIEKLEKPQKQEILEQISHINLEQIFNLYEATKIKEQETQSEISPINYIDKSKIPNNKSKEIEKIGEEIIRNDNYAVVTMAGRSRNKIRI